MAGLTVDFASCCKASTCPTRLKLNEELGKRRAASKAQHLIHSKDSLCPHRLAIWKKHPFGQCQSKLMQQQKQFLHQSFKAKHRSAPAQQPERSRSAIILKGRISTSNAVRPYTSAASRSAPSSTSCFIMGSSPIAAAWCSGVIPVRGFCVFKHSSLCSFSQWVMSASGSLKRNCFSACAECFGVMPKQRRLLTALTKPGPCDCAKTSHSLIHFLAPSVYQHERLTHSKRQDHKRQSEAY